MLAFPIHGSEMDLMTIYGDVDSLYSRPRLDSSLRGLVKKLMTVDTDSGKRIAYKFRLPIPISIFLTEPGN
jgi:hypothetical protein